MPMPMPSDAAAAGAARGPDTRRRAGAAARVPLELFAVRSVRALHRLLVGKAGSLLPGASRLTLLAAESRREVLTVVGGGGAPLGWRAIPLDGDHPCALALRRSRTLLLPLSPDLATAARYIPGRRPGWVAIAPLARSGRSGRGRACLVALLYQRPPRLAAARAGLAQVVGTVLERLQWEARARRRGRARAARARRLAALAAVPGALVASEGQVAVQAREDFLSLAVHELVGPLASASMLASATLSRVAGAQLPPGDPSRTMLENTRRQIDQAAALVGQLAEVVRRRDARVSPRRAPVHLGELVGRVMTQQAAQLPASPLKLHVSEPGEGRLRGRWDPGQIEQVVRNLVGNAIKFGAGKPVEVSVGAGAGGMTVAVQDHGIGIAAADQARIFERFERAVPRRQYTGLGLGLWLVREIVRAHDGRISVSSTAGVGSRFEVWLPAQGP